MEESVSDKKNYKSENNDEEKELGCLDDTSSDDMEGDFCYKNDNKNEKTEEKKS